MKLKPDRRIELPEPWSWTDEDFTKQLKTEIGQSHILYNKSVKTIARREDRDDFLFELDDSKFAVVHLTWQSSEHKNGTWPITKIFNDWEDLYNNQILPDEEEFK